jgi:hypothetical protein
MRPHLGENLEQLRLGHVAVKVADVERRLGLCDGGRTGRGRGDGGRLRGRRRGGSDFGGHDGVGRGVGEGVVGWWEEVLVPRGFSAFFGARKTSFLCRDAT